jgi:hypothetical protein
MVGCAIVPCCEIDTPTLHDLFLTLLPRLETHAKVTFRGIRCTVKREEAVQDCRALAWRWLIRLAERDKDVSQFSTVFISLVVRAVRCGRRLCGQERARDVLSPRAQRRYGFQVERLPTSTRTGYEALYSEPRGQQHLDAFEERLRDNTQTPIPDQVQFRIDFRNWLLSLDRRERALVTALMAGERTTDVARTHRISAGRVSQLRREFHLGWLAYCGELTDEALLHTAAA